MNIAVPSVAAPPPGAAQAGDLYVDLQSRTLWLGVDTAVDPAGFVLISDMVTIMQEISAGDTTARAYTDQQVATRAPAVHTHTSSQITDFTSAVTAVASAIPSLSYTRGMILMWSGSLAQIGVGALAGWGLCDGGNGTPDLRDKFIMGAGNRAVGAVNQPSFVTTDGGSHDHSIAGTAITIAQMPSHRHGTNTGTDSVGHQHYTTTGGISANHTHSYTTRAQLIKADWGSDAGSPASYFFQDSGLQTGTVSADHSHAGWSGTPNQYHTHAVSAEGGGGEHTHVTVGGGGIHNHTITSAQLRETVPFFALAYIMKL